MKRHDLDAAFYCGMGAGFVGAGVGSLVAYGHGFIDITLGVIALALAHYEARKVGRA